LSNLNQYRFENIFKVYKNKSGYYYYNIINNIAVPGILRPGTFYTFDVERKLSYTSLSYMAYKTIHLWWLICIVNKIQNPVQFPETGTELHIIYPEEVTRVVANIKSQL